MKKFLKKLSIFIYKNFLKKNIGIFIFLKGAKHMNEPNPNRLVNLPCAQFLNDALAQLSTENPDAIVIMASTADGKTMFCRYHVSLHDYYIFQGMLQSEATEFLLKLRDGEQQPFSENEDEEADEEALEDE